MYKSARCTEAAVIPHRTKVIHICLFLISDDILDQNIPIWIWFKLLL